MEKTERADGAAVPPRRRTLLRREMVWPVILAVAIALVVAVNAVFIYVAMSGADEVAPSYTEGER